MFLHQVAFDHCLMAQDAVHSAIGPIIEPIVPQTGITGQGSSTCGQIGGYRTQNPCRRQTGEMDDTSAGWWYISPQAANGNRYGKTHAAQRQPAYPG